MSSRTHDDVAVSAWRERLSTIDSGQGQVAYLDIGDGQPVVMLHGIPTHAYLWRDVADVVALGQRAIVPDLLGFGFSEKSGEADLTPYGQAVAMASLLDELEIERFILAGHDYGALVACEMLRRMPERIERLVLTNTSLRSEDWTSRSPLNPLAIFKIPVAGEAALKAAKPFMLKQAFSFFIENRQRLDDEAMALYWEPFRNGFDRTLLRLSRENRLDEDAFHGWKAALYDFKRPSLVVWGGKDPVFKPDRAHEIVRLLSTCQYELFVHSNHFIQEDRPAALGRLISAFVEGRHDG